MIMSRYSQMMEEFSHISQATEYSLETLLIMDIHRTGLKLIGNNTCRGSVIIRIGERFFVTYIANSAGLKTNYEIRRINDNWKLFYEEVRIFSKYDIDVLEVYEKADLLYRKYMRRETHEFINDYMIINPLTVCFNRCKGCARYYNFYGSDDYITNMVKISEQIFYQKSRFVYIVTGCNKNPKADRDMFQKIIEISNNHAGSKLFAISTSSIETTEQMKLFNNLGVIQLTGTIETIDNSSFFKKVNGFEKKADRLIEACRYFEAVDANIVLGYDEPNKILKQLERFIDTQVTVRYYIPRLYSEDQKRLIHPAYQTLAPYAEIADYIDNTINKGKILSDTYVQKKLGIYNLALRIVGTYQDYNYLCQEVSL